MNSEMAYCLNCVVNCEDHFHLSLSLCITLQLVPTNAKTLLAINQIGLLNDNDQFKPFGNKKVCFPGPGCSKAD